MNIPRFIQNTILSSLLGLGVVLTAQAHEFNNSDLIGAYGYSFAGNYGPDFEFSINEVGVFKADGHGRIKAQGRTIEDGSTQLFPTYDCTYVVHPTGTIDVACERTDANGIFPTEFILVLDGHNREVRIEAVPLAPFARIAVTGSGHKQ